MPIVAFNIKFTDAERKLLAKRAKAEGMTEADYLRVCMVLDAAMSGDVSALKLIGQKLLKLAESRIRAAALHVGVNET